ncbi:carbohydrate-binding family 9-like protein [candidate division KSB1 bacterium]|nr:carbohydrate-binding family 9-like protein [candidate division KSB1 bacterium]
MTFSLPIYICKRIARPLILTGKVDDPLWQAAPLVNLHDALTGAPGRFATTVRALYDAEYLYVAFACEDDYVWGTITAHDGPIYEEECVEVFINPAHAAHQYYEINVSPRNVVFDACILNARTPAQPSGSFLGLQEWHAEGLRTAVHIEGELNRPGKAKGWSAEFAIPFRALIGAPHVPPKPGDEWRVNFYRIDTPLHAKSELYAWSATGLPTFHLPWRFGTLRFDRF